jgi:hypothetical protein
VIVPIEPSSNLEEMQSFNLIQIYKVIRRHVDHVHLKIKYEHQFAERLFFRVPCAELNRHFLARGLLIDESSTN